MSQCTPGTTIILKGLFAVTLFENNPNIYQEETINNMLTMESEGYAKLLHYTLVHFTVYIFIKIACCFPNI
jgi:hypothetical protein